jgi:hypothetical protein
MSDDDDIRRCAWCGKPFKLGTVGRRATYCGRSCRQRAYEMRREAKRFGEMVRRMQAGPPVPAAPVSSRVEAPTLPIPTRDETKPAGPAPDALSNSTRDESGQAAPTTPRRSPSEVWAQMPRQW